MDLTGDGVTDVIRSGNRLECFFNHPKVGWQETRWVERKRERTQIDIIAAGGRGIDSL